MSRYEECRNKGERDRAWQKKWECKDFTEIDKTVTDLRDQLQKSKQREAVLLETVEILILAIRRQTCQTSIREI